MNKRQNFHATGPTASEGLIARLAEEHAASPRFTAAVKLAVRSHAQQAKLDVDGDDIGAFLEALQLDGVSCGHAQWSGVLGALARTAMIGLACADGRFSMKPRAGRFVPDTPPLDLDQHLKLCRFTSISSTDGAIMPTNPLADRSIILNRPEDAGLVMRFSAPLKPAALPAEDHLLIANLAAGGFLLPCDEAGHDAAERDPVLQMWEPQDLALHMSSRTGLAAVKPGSRYDFTGVIDEASIKTPMPEIANWVDLPAPRDDLDDPGLFATMQARHSIRAFANAGLSPEQLGAVLHHALGERKPGGWRRYPNGGAMYEQQFFLTVGQYNAPANAIPPGFYLYDTTHHRLGQIDTRAEDRLSMFAAASGAMGGAQPPPVVLTIASEFAKVRWKYTGLSYALQLKHVGVIQHALYLAATAMGLGGCALGTGDSALFARMSGLAPLRVGAIGEFVFGLPAEE